MYLVIDWLFASHYFKMACLFRIVFSSHSVQKLRKIKQVKKWLIGLDILVYTVIMITCVIFKKWELKLFYFLLLWT